jgi:hypothetical protein
MQPEFYLPHDYPGEPRLRDLPRHPQNWARIALLVPAVSIHPVLITVIRPFINMGRSKVRGWQLGACCVAIHSIAGVTTPYHRSHIFS